MLEPPTRAVLGLRALAPLPKWLLTGAASVVGAALLLNFGAGSESLDTVRVFATDEASAVNRLRDALDARSLDPHPFFRYGNAYTALCYALVRGLEALGYPLSPNLVVLAMRLVSAASCLVMALLVVGAAKNLGVSRTLAASAGIATAASAEVLLYAMMIHPDTLQMMFCAATVFFLTRGPGLWNTGCAALCVGLAAATKYGGGALLGMVAVVLVLRELGAETRRERLAGLLRTAKLGFGCLLLAGIVFSLVNVHAWLHVDQFWQEVLFEARHVTRGHGGEDNRTRLRWGIALYRMGLPVLLIFGGLAFALVESGTRAWKSRFRASQAVLVFGIALAVTLLLLQLFVDVRSRQARYLFPVVPASATVAAWAMQQWFDRRAAGRTFLPMVGVGLFTLLCAVQGAAYPMMVEQRAGQYGGPASRFGNWLAEHLPPSTKFVADRRVLVPPLPARRYFEHQLDKAIIDRRNPDVIALAKTSTGRLVWPKPGTDVRDRQWETSPLDDTPATVAALTWLIGPSSGYVPVYQDDSWIAFAKRDVAESLEKREK